MIQNLLARNIWRANISVDSGGNKPVTYELKPVAINIIGNVANVFLFIKWNGDKMPVTISGRQYSTWIKEDNKWKYMGGMGCSCDRSPYCE